MNLLQLRTKFRSLSGRHDLVNADYSDNGADFFINEGRKFLDRLDETQKSWASVFRFLESGKWTVTFPYCRAIKEVWAATLTAKWQLTKMDLHDLTETFLTDFPSDLTQGDTDYNNFYYSPIITRYIPEDATADTFEAWIGHVMIPAGDAHEYNGIVVMPPPDQKMMLEIQGLFYSMELVSDTDKNYWSEVHPSLLIQAAMREIEIINRNTQGVNDWTNSIAVQMQQLGFDLVEELIAEVEEMEG